MKNLSQNQLRHCNVPPNHRPVCSLISQKHCHPWARHDSSRNKGLRRFTHSQRYTSRPSQHSWGYQAILETGETVNAKMGSHWRAKNTYSRTSLTSRTPTHTRHKESVPSLLHSPSGPDFPSHIHQVCLQWILVVLWYEKPLWSSPGWILHDSSWCSSVELLDSSSY